MIFERVSQIDPQYKRFPYPPFHTLAPGTLTRIPLTAGRQRFAEGGRRLRDRDVNPNTAPPLISVITVCKNAANTLGKAIDSVFRQGYSNIEYIIIDGASSDRTLSVIREYESRIEYFVSEEDDGIYHAMNKGIALSTGAFVALLNADDHWLPNFLEASFEALERTGADLSYCDYHTETGLVECPTLTEGFLFSQLSIKHNTFLIRKQCFYAIGAFDESYSLVADAKWNRAAYLSGLRFVHTNQALVFYSNSGASAADDEVAKARMIDESERLIRECFPFLGRDEAKSLYTANFNTQTLHELIRLYRRHASDDPLFPIAIEHFLQYNLIERRGYLAYPDRPQQLCRLIDACEALNIPFTYIRFAAMQPLLIHALAKFQEFRVHRNKDGEAPACTLHFARRFSAPSEPFIYNTVKSLAEREPDTSHVVLCDERLLEQERPFDAAICIPWATLSDSLRRRLYELLWNIFRPSLIVAHFALNGYWLYQRLNAEQRKTPTLNICHGIDVFSIDRSTEYGRYILEYASLAPRVAFTTVSNFLRDCLQAAGVPGNKIFPLPNSISDAFFQHRKTHHFYRGDRPLRILCIGRLIAWKGHDILIRALADVQTRIPNGVKVTLVYAEWDEELPTLLALCRELGVSDSIEFLPFVDLANQPDFYSRFDLFVLPSTLSADDPPRTETFGVAALEAIASGLPIITTDAGGLPEVVGQPNALAEIVPHGDSRRLADAILRRTNSPERHFFDNIHYARERVALFSQDAQYAYWQSAKDWLYRSLLKIYHFSALTEGGAAGATLAIHKALLRRGYDSVFVTRSDRRSSMPPYSANVEYLHPTIALDWATGQGREKLKNGYTIFSIDQSYVSNDELCDLLRDADIINFAWFGQFISSDNIAAVSRLGKPVLITLRDMNPITGGCHYFHGCSQWRNNCTGCPQLKDNSDELPHFVFQNKLLNWNQASLTFLALSEHSRQILLDSPVTEGARIERLSNFVDSAKFFVSDRATARAELAFANDEFVIGYLPSFNSFIKGHEELLRALHLLRSEKPTAKITLALATEAPLFGTLPFKVCRVGKLKDVESLRSFYNAVDVIAVPSLEETFSNTTIEALACGTRVIGFQTGILAELLQDRQLGAAVPTGDSMALARAFAEAMEAPASPEYCMEVAHREFDECKQVAAYSALIDSLVANNTSGTPTLPGDAYISENVNPATELLTHRARRTALAETERLARLQGHLERTATTNAQLRRKVRFLEQHIAQLHESTSWRVTQPLRALRLLFKNKATLGEERS